MEGNSRTNINFGTGTGRTQAECSLSRLSETRPQIGRYLARSISTVKTSLCSRRSHEDIHKENTLSELGELGQHPRWRFKRNRESTRECACLWGEEKECLWGGVKEERGKGKVEREEVVCGLCERSHQCFPSSPNPFIRLVKEGIKASHL